MMRRRAKLLPNKPLLFIGSTENTMLARAGAVAMSHGSLRRASFLVGSTVAAAGGASIVKSKFEDHGLNVATYNNFQFTPTLEAGVRAMRLIRTAALIVMDYEVAKVKPYFFAEDLGKEEKEHKRLESDMEQREMELEKAQLEYASEDNSEVKKLSPQERKQVKLEQKRRMKGNQESESYIERQLTDYWNSAEQMVVPISKLDSILQTWTI